MTDYKILMLASDGDSTNIIYNFLNARFNVGMVIIEQRERPSEIIARRIRRLGFQRVLGQICFQVFLVPFLRRVVRQRIKDILCDAQLDLSQIDSRRVVRVRSVNEATTSKIIEEYNPDLVVVNGTRIISAKTLRSISSKIVNTHAGITPNYRGVHGLYWALVNGEPELGGVTVHFVDNGIDTGGIIYQEIVSVTERDNFASYPYLQLVKGVKILEMAINDIKSGKVRIITASEESRLWYHPTFMEYLYQRFCNGVR
jgi:folate-dependent phosphoribosylglycinamide formyltransferase PurN